MSIDNAKPEEWNDVAYLAGLADSNAVAELTPLDVTRLNQLLDQPFGEVPYVTRAYVFLLHQMGKVRAIDVDIPFWVSDGHYQLEVVEKPKTKPSIDWSHVAPRYKWLARNESGYSLLFENMPTVTSAYWSTLGVSADSKDFASYVPGDCDWEDSLVERPAGV